MKLSVKLVLIIVGVSIISVSAKETEDTIPKDPIDDDVKETFRNLVRPFRMEKLNLIWVKAQQVKKFD